MTYIPLLIFVSFFLFSVYLFDNFLKLNVRWGVKKTLIKRKKPLPLFAVSSDSGLYYLFISLSSNILIFLLYSFSFSIIQSSLFILFLYHLIPPYSFISHNSFLYSLFQGIYLEVINSFVTSGIRQFCAQFFRNCLTDWILSYIFSELSHFKSKMQDSVRYSRLS